MSKKIGALLLFLMFVAVSGRPQSQGQTPASFAGLPAVVQTDGSNVTTVLATVPFSQGNCVFVLERSTTGALTAPTDTQLNTYNIVGTTQNTSSTFSTAFHVSLYVATNVVGGPDTITIGGGTGTLGMAYLETTPCAVDTSNQATGATATLSAGNVTTTSANELLVLFGFNNRQQGYTAVGAPTVIINPSSGGSYNATFSADQVRSISTYSRNQTIASASDWAAWLVGVKGAPPFIIGISPTLSVGSLTPLGTIGSANQVIQFAVSSNPQAFPSSKLTITVPSGSITPVYLTATNSGNVANLNNIPRFVLEASNDGGLSWSIVPGLYKQTTGTPSGDLPAIFSAQYDLTGLSSAWFRFSVTSGYGISNLVVYAGLG